MEKSRRGGCLTKPKTQETRNETKENNKIKFKIHLRPKQIGSEIGAHTTNKRHREGREKRQIE